MPDHYAPVSVTCEKPVDTSNVRRGGMVATGISGGVDSTYTLVCHSGGERSDNFLPLTHGTYFDFQYDEQGRVSQKMEHWATLAKSICSEYGLTMLRVGSNIVSEVYRMVHDKVVTAVFCSYVLAVQNGVSTYYFSSTTSASEFELNPHAMSHYDLLNLPMFSTNRVTFYPAGCEVNRLEKVEYLSKDERTRGYLMPCSATNTNAPCGRCSKCTRTMCELDVLGKLDDYSDLFDITFYREHPGYYWGYILLKRKTDPFCAEILEELKRQGRRLPPVAYFCALAKWVKMGFRTENPLASSYRP